MADDIEAEAIHQDNQMLVEEETKEEKYELSQKSI